MEGCKRPQRTYIYVIYISKTYIDAEFDVESFGMVYLASKGRLGKVICEETYLFEQSITIYGESQPFFSR